MANKIGIVVDKMIRELKEDLIFKSPCLKLLEKNQFFDNPEEIYECELILDGTFGNVLFEDAKKMGASIIKENFEKEQVVLEDFKIYKCENISLIFDKARMIFLDEEVRKLHTVNKMNFQKFLTRKIEELFPDLDFTEVIVEQQSIKNTVKLVKEMPETKEDNTTYLTLETAQKLNRIFDIIDSIKTDGE